MKKLVDVGGVIIGDGNITLQSMTNTTTEDIDTTLGQLRALYSSGADLVRVSANTVEAAKAIYTLREQLGKPIIADIHFSSKLAMLSMEAGADKIRINPGNIETDDLVKIIKYANQKVIPIRIGVNSGSVKKEFLEKYSDLKDAMFYSLKHYIEFFEANNFDNLVLSAKSSDVKLNIEVNKMIAKAFDYPLHLGVTEAGIRESAIIKSSIGIGSLLAEGIGDTIRVSITGDPLQEIPVAKEILSALGLRKSLNIVSCPTCARCSVDLESIVREVKGKLDDDINANIAIMGCAVNGPGEAKNADIGIAGSGKKLVLFEKGVVTGKYTKEEVVDVLVNKVSKMED